MKYYNYMCPFCGKIFYTKEDIEFNIDSHELKNATKNLFVNNTKRHMNDCLENMRGIQQKIMLKFVSVSDQQLSLSEDLYQEE